MPKKKMHAWKGREDVIKERKRGLSVVRLLRKVEQSLEYEAVWVANIAAITALRMRK